MKTQRGPAGLLFLIGALFLTACQPSQDPNANEAQTLTLYAGRSKPSIEALIKTFEAETGITAQVRYGETAEVAMAVMEEKTQSPADVFWAQDATALGAVSDEGLLAELPESILSMVPEAFRSRTKTWVATSGRVRVLAYAPDRVAAGALPTSIFDLSDPAWKGRIGWAPSNGSFQSFVTAMRKLAGDERTREWLLAMKANEPKAYPNNTTQVQAIANGEIDLALPNHYYLLRFKKDDAAYPVEQTFFEAQDPGNLINVAGVGILKTAKNREAAETFVRFLLSRMGQEFFTNTVFEYAVVEGIPPGTFQESFDALMQAKPDIDLNELNDLDQTLALLQEVGLL